MSVLNWFSRKTSAESTSPPSSGMPLEAETVPPTRKSERSARRELLYTTIRECMVRAGVLTAAYKFKVLSLDGHGRQFMVMVDLAGQQDGSTARLAEIEAAIAQAAKARHDIVVKAVYWRQKEGVAAGTQPRQGGAAKAAAAAPVPSSEAPKPAPQMVAAAPHNPHEPINADEVAAFKHALATGTKPPARALDGREVKGPQSYTLLTGFEDTEMHQDAQGKLSSSQHGDLT
jgi:hypothetical protein